MRVLLALTLALILTSCASSQPQPAPYTPPPVTGPTSWPTPPPPAPTPWTGPAAPQQDLVYQALTELADGPLLNRMKAEAAETLRRIASWPPGSVSDVNLQLAAMCPNAISTQVDSLRAQILQLRDMLAALKAQAGADVSGGLMLLPIATDLAYGPRAFGGVTVETLKADIRSRARLLLVGCSAIPTKVMGDINDLLIKAGIGAVLPGAGAIPGVLGGLGR